MTAPSTPPTRCLIALGSNLGDRMENLRAGVAGIGDTPGIDIVAVSPLYETAPVGGPDDQGPYLNAALAADTTLGASDLLALLHRIEAGRERQRVVHWGPRTLDLDLLVHGDLVCDAETDIDTRIGTRTLQVPHPRMHERRFVMAPVCDIAPDLVHPRLGRTMRDLLADLPVEPGDLTQLTDTWHTIPEHSP
ncbi:MAG TPA: 2-amino-4-hydroxy-6-hydroxymethyldihydropteridine diphosphokinase [Ilumatobacteraceae bacterium]|nr:2-amino-4-hydroxy-6-hydroxymethyldihydropteridine diphosphokinase [Ilumatobacteraceae bacterium]